MMRERPSRFRAACRVLRRAHRNEDGVVMILFFFLVIIFGMMLALMWNIGRVIAAKNRAQAAADQGAFAAASWNSRALNIATATNMLILRNASAEVSARAIRHVFNGVQDNWQAALVAAEACPPAPDSNPCLDEYNALLAQEIGPFTNFVDRCYVEAARCLDEATFRDRIIEVSEFQTGFLEAIPDVIEAQRQEVERFVGARVILAVPGRDDGLIVPPLRRGDRASFERMLRERRVTDNLRPGGVDFAQFEALGRGRTLWLEGVERAIVEVANEFAAHHFVLITQDGAEEISPTAAGREEFSIFATAVVEEVSEEYGFWMMGFYDREISVNDTVVSCAQSEVYNIYDEQRAALNSPSAFPFRVWTTRGWSWQPRMTRCTFMTEVFEADEETRLAIMGMGIGENHRGRILLALQH